MTSRPKFSGLDNTANRPTGLGASSDLSDAEVAGVIGSSLLSGGLALVALGYFGGTVAALETGLLVGSVIGVTSCLTLAGAVVLLPMGIAAIFSSDARHALSESLDAIKIATSGAMLIVMPAALASGVGAKQSAEYAEIADDVVKILSGIPTKVSSGGYARYAEALNKYVEFDQAAADLFGYILDAGEGPTNSRLDLDFGDGPATSRLKWSDFSDVMNGSGSGGGDTQVTTPGLGELGQPGPESGNTDDFGNDDEQRPPSPPGEGI